MMNMYKVCTSPPFIYTLILLPVQVPHPFAVSEVLLEVRCIYIIMLQMICILVKSDRPTRFRLLKLRLLLCTFLVTWREGNLVIAVF